MNKNKKFTNKKRVRNSSRNARSEEEVSNHTYSRDNDWSWYAVNAQLLKDTASYSYAYPLGSALDMGERAADITNSTSIPGIMTIHTSATIGSAQSINDPINIAARNIYATVRNVNSGAKNYDPVDIMLYLVAISECYSYLSWMQRLFGISNLISQTNRYQPMALSYAQGVDFNDILTHKADFRAYVNSFATQLATLAVPATLPYYARHVWMYRGYYCDSPVNDKAQIYMYVPTGFYQYQLDTESAGMLKYTALPMRNPVESRIITPTTESYGMTLAEIVTFGQNLLGPVLGSSDCALISGDILKAFTSAQCLLPEAVSETYSVLPSYSEEVLNQINNASLMGRRVALNYTSSHTGHAQNDIYQSDDKGYLKSDFAAYQYLHEQWISRANTINADQLQQEMNTTALNIDYSTASNQFINFTHGDVQPADTMVATRLLNMSGHYANILDTGASSPEALRLLGFNSSQTGSKIVAFRADSVTLGSDVAEYAKMWYFAYPNRGLNRTWSLVATEDIYSVMFAVLPIYNGYGIEDSSQKQADDFRRTAMMSMFGRHPRTSLLAITAVMTDDSYTIYQSSSGLPLDDINYYTIIDHNDLTQMAQTALLSEFNIAPLGNKVI